jgi:ADP-heptose:LPS heptosyltransferase
MPVEIGNIRKIAIFRALQLGDILCSIPAIRALKSRYPDADIYLIGLPGAEDLVKRFRRYFSGFISFPGYPGLPEQRCDVKAITSFITYMQHQAFDLILQMHGNGTCVNQFIELLGAKYCGGFYTPYDFKPAGNLFMAYPNSGHETERHLKLMSHLGIPDGSSSLEFPIHEEDMNDFYKLNLDLEKNKYICVHPGSRQEWRQWPRENFARMADLCIEGNMPVVITGTREELEIAEGVAHRMKYDPVILAGKTNLGSMAVLLSNAYGLISNCNGISHMAAALQVPGIIISLDGEPRRWGPLNKNLFYTLDWISDPDYEKAEAALLTLLREGTFMQDQLQYA